MTRFQLLLLWLAKSWCWDDGLDITEYVRALEAEFEVELRQEDLGCVFTLWDMVVCIARKREQIGRAMSEEEIWPILRRITADQLAIDASELHRRMRYVEELCC